MGTGAPGGCVEPDARRSMCHGGRANGTAGGGGGGQKASRRWNGNVEIRDTHDGSECEAEVWKTTGQ